MRRAAAAIALGSNLPSRCGDRAATLHEAATRVAALGRDMRLSSFYDTSPVGEIEQPRFLNAALTLETGLAPLDLMRQLLVIERLMGRDREAAPLKGPRVIDLDLLLYREADRDVMMHTAELTLPHPSMADRWFVLKPLAEVAGEWIHPVAGIPVQEMLSRLAVVG